MEEVWKDIEGYEYYQVSNLGRIRSLDREIIHSNGKHYFYKGQILKCGYDTDGYCQVTIGSGKTRRTKKVHQIVAKHFIPNPDNLPCINHKNERKNDNRVDNLEWCTVAYNNSYGTRTERMTEKVKGKIFSAEHRKRISESRKGMHIKEETKEKLSKALKGRYNEKNCKPVLQYDKEGNFIKEWPSTREIERQLGYSSGCISNCCLNKIRKRTNGHFYVTQTAYNFIWKYKEVG